MISTPQIYMPLAFYPFKAIAYDIPPGFEDFDRTFVDMSSSENFIELMVNLNKNCILAVLEQLHTVGIFN